MSTCPSLFCSGRSVGGGSGILAFWTETGGYLATERSGKDASACSPIGSRPWSYAAALSYVTRRGPPLWGGVASRTARTDETCLGLVCGLVVTHMSVSFAQWINWIHSDCCGRTHPG